MGIALLVGGMALSVGAPADARAARLLAERGIETTATVTDVTDRPSSDYALVGLEIPEENGSPRQSFELIYCGDPESIEPGDAVGVVYDPEGVLDPRFSECEPSQEITIPLLIGVGAIAAGVVCVLMAWRASGWRKRWRGIPVLLVGLVLAGASFEDTCECREFVYTGVALAVIGTVPLVAPRDGARGRDLETRNDVGSTGPG